MWSADCIEGTGVGQSVEFMVTAPQNPAGDDRVTLAEPLDHMQVQSWEVWNLPIKGKS